MNGPQRTACLAKGYTNIWYIVKRTEWQTLNPHRQDWIMVASISEWDVPQDTEHGTRKDNMQFLVWLVHRTFARQWKDNNTLWGMIEDQGTLRKIANGNTFLSIFHVFGCKMEFLLDLRYAMFTQVAFIIDSTRFNLPRWHWTDALRNVTLFDWRLHLAESTTNITWDVGEE